MIFDFMDFDQHVIHKNLYISANLLMEHLVHEPLISCPDIFKAKWHHLVTKQALVSDKGGFFSSSCVIRIGLYPEKASMNVRSLCLAVASTNWSMHERG